MNARTPISGNLPVEAALALYDAADVMRSEPTEKELDEARDEIADEIIAGERVAGVDRMYVLEAELNRDETGLDFLRELAPVLFALYADQAAPSSYWCRAEEYLREIVCKHIPDEAVWDRAWETLTDREADRLDALRDAMRDADEGAREEAAIMRRGE